MTPGSSGTDNKRLWTIIGASLGGSVLVATILLVAGIVLRRRWRQNSKSGYRSVATGGRPSALQQEVAPQDGRELLSPGEMRGLTASPGVAMASPLATRGRDGSRRAMDIASPSAPVAAGHSQA
jgi:hypothetical protein